MNTRKTEMHRKLMRNEHNEENTITTNLWLLIKKYYLPIKIEASLLCRRDMLDEAEHARGRRKNNGSERKVWYETK